MPLEPHEVQILDGRKVGWFWAENAIADRAWDTKAKITYLMLCRYADRGGKSWPSHDTLAKAAGLSERAVRMAVAFLIEAGAVSALPRAGRSSVYRVERLTTPAPGADVPRHVVPASVDNRGRNGHPASLTPAHGADPSARGADEGKVLKENKDGESTAVGPTPRNRRGERPRPQHRIHLNAEVTGWDGITEEDRTVWTAAAPRVDLDQELAKALGQQRGLPASERVKNGGAFLARWMNRAQAMLERQGPAQRTPAIGGHPRTAGNADAARQYLEQATGAVAGREPRDVTPRSQT